MRSVRVVRIFNDSLSELPLDINTKEIVAIEPVKVINTRHYKEVIYTLDTARVSFYMRLIQFANWL